MIPALVAIGALSVAMTVGPAAGASGGHAVAAKKKCKKKKSKSSAESAKKKKCKKKKKAVAPVVRATLNWSNGGSNDVDMDLFVFGASGHRRATAPTRSPRAPSLRTSLVRLEARRSPTWRSTRSGTLSFGVCYMVGGSVHTDYTITYVTADGVTHTETRADDGNPPSLGNSAHVNYPGGTSIPSDYCPGTSLVP